MTDEDYEAGVVPYNSEWYETGGSPYDIGAATHVGRRAHNEDAFLVDADNQLLVVADGVGGHAAGEVASQLACEVLKQHWRDNHDLTGAVREANTEVARVAGEKGTKGMGTTVVAVTTAGPEFEIAWVGDSRAYYFDDDLHLLTRDHSLIEARISMGELAPEEAEAADSKNVILQALGLVPAEKLEIGSNRISLAPGARLLVCSDGLSGVVDNATIVELLSAREPAQVIAERLVQKAVELGGSDNVTVAVIAATESTLIVADVAPSIVWTYHAAKNEVEYFQNRPKMRQIKSRAPSKVEAPTTPAVEDASSITKPSSGRGMLLPLVVFAALVLALFLIKGQ
jgi:protein phosphatase